MQLRAKFFASRGRALSNRDNPEIRGLEMLPLVAQLNELLSTVGSPKMPHEHQHRRLLLPVVG